jgi:hypothetical protein
MSLFLRACFSSSFLLLALPAAADEIGKATIGGRTIIIDSNGTWRYASEAGATALKATDCTAGYAYKDKKLPFIFCLPPSWKIDQSPQGSMELQAHNNELDLYMGVIVERSEMTAEMLRSAALYNAATATGVRTEDIPIVIENKQSFAGQEWNYLSYDVVFSGSKFRFGNYGAVLPKGGVIQVVFWSSPTFFDQNKVAMVEIMQTTKLTQP